MKNVFRRIKLPVFMLVVWAVVPATWARSVLIMMDAEVRGEAPADFGYSVSAVEDGDLVRFTAELNPVASAAFRSARIFFNVAVENQPEIPVKVVSLEGKKSFRFPFR